MYREPKLPHVLCGLSFCEACHFVRPIPVPLGLSFIKRERDPELWAVELLLFAHCTCYSAQVWVILQSVKMRSPLLDEADTPPPLF